MEPCRVYDMCFHFCDKKYENLCMYIEKEREARKSDYQFKFLISNPIHLLTQNLLSFQTSSPTFVLSSLYFDQSQPKLSE